MNAFRNKYFFTVSIFQPIKNTLPEKCHKISSYPNRICIIHTLNTVEVPGIYILQAYTVPRRTKHFNRVHFSLALAKPKMFYIFFQRRYFFLCFLLGNVYLHFAVKDSDLNSQRHVFVRERRGMWPVCVLVLKQNQCNTNGTSDQRTERLKDHCASARVHHDSCCCCSTVLVFTCVLLPYCFRYSASPRSRFAHSAHCVPVAAAAAAAGVGGGRSVRHWCPPR